MKFGNFCPMDDTDWPNDLCNAEGYCMKSYPAGDTDRFESDDAACRTVPRAYIDLENMIFVDDADECGANQNFCPTCSQDETCKMSYHMNDPNQENGPTAACRCQPS